MADIDIVVRDATAYLGNLDVDEELHEAVINATKFKRAGSEYQLRRVPKHKREQLEWVRLVKNQKCPVGLLDRVCRVITEAGHTPKVAWATEQELKPDLGWEFTGFTPRDYQTEALVATAINDRGIIRAPTGAGKTIMAIMAMNARGKQAVVIVPTIDLLYQFKGVLEGYLPVDPDACTRCGGQFGNGGHGPGFCTDRGYRIGQLGDGVVDPQPVTVATIRTMAAAVNVAYESYEFAEYDDKDDTQVDAKQLREWIDGIGTVIVDEAHQLGAQTTYDVVTRIPATAKYGLSASPWRDDGADLQIEAATGPLIYRINVQRLVDEGWLLAPKIVTVDTSGWWKPAAWGRICKRCGHQALQFTTRCDNCNSPDFKSQFTECYKVEIVDNALRNCKIAELVGRLSDPTLVLVKQVRHGRALADVIPDSVFLSGKDKGQDRERVFNQVRAGEIRCVICTTIGDMGLDIPNLTNLVLAGGGKSSTRHLQRIGRIVRPLDGKPQPQVIDLDDSHVHSWFSDHAKARRKVEKAEWAECAIWEAA